MANLELQKKIDVPFADKGDKINVPDTSSEGSVNMTDGFGSKYDTPIAEGGEYIYREEMNDILNKVYAAVKELQDLAITAGFPVDMTKALNVLPIANGGTGANNASQARSNLGLGTLATKSTITSADITDGTITANDIANNAVTTSKITDTAVTANKLASSAVTNAKIAAGAITGNKLVNKTITATQIADNTITATQLATNSVGADELANGAVTDSKLSGVISIAHGGTGVSDITSNNCKLFPSTRTNYSTLDLNKATHGILICSPNLLTNKPSFINSGEVVVTTLLDENAATFDDGSNYSYNIQFYSTRSSFELAARYCNYEGTISPWTLIRNVDGSCPLNMPMITTASGVGQLVTWNQVATYTIPAGGTWFVYYIFTQGTGFYDLYTQLLSGGTQLGVSGYSLSGFAIRIK